MSFTFPLPAIRPLRHDAGEAYELVEDMLDADGNLLVEAGYVTDLASVPRPFRVLLPTAGLVTAPAIRHDDRCDALNAWHEAWVEAGCPLPGSVEHDALGVPPLPSIDADREFLAGLRELDPQHPLRNLVYYAGVRVGAWGNPARRDGWREDAGRVLVILLLVAPLYAPTAAWNLLALTVDRAANRLACRLTRRNLAEVVELPAPALECAA